MKILLRSVLIIIVLILSWNCSGRGVRTIQINNGAELLSDDYNLKVQFYTKNIVRVVKWASSGSSDKTTLSVTKNEPDQLDILMEDKGNILLLSSDKLSIEINKTDFNVQYLSKNNEIILREFGVPQFQAVVYDTDSGYSFKQNFKLTISEGIYGLGQHQYGYFNYRGKEVVLLQSKTDAVNPFLISTNNYGILWDNYSKTIFKDDEKSASLWSDMGNNIDYYFVAGASMDEVISGYRTLTGKTPMYGKHAYGYWQSKEHYDTQAELMQVARKYRALKITIDNMIQDWDYWNGAQNWSGMFFDETLFPKPKEICDELHDKNYYIIISIWPALGPNTPIYRDMLSNGFLYEPVGWAGFKYYDAYNPEANKLYWKYLKDGIYSKGLDGWWIDSTEPDVVNAMTKESSEYELKKMGSNYLGSSARYMNSFSLVMTNDLYKFWRETDSTRRACILTRSTYAGQQRNAATTWSGDIGASWEVYRNQISAGLNHSMSGIP